MSNEPRTAAGRRVWSEKPIGWNGQDWRAAILAIEAEAREPAGLREALERLMAVAMIEEEDQSPATQDEWIAAMKQAQAALAATPPAPALDVERLWRVLESIGVIKNGTWVSFQREDAEKIADRYARLTEAAEGE